MSMNVCVFCGSSPGKNPIYAQTANALGASLAKRKMPLVYGGAHVGLMGEVAQAAMKSGGTVYGVIPKTLQEREVAFEKITKLEVVDTLAERKQRMFDLSDAFVTIPGGLGTLDELYEVITWAHLGIHQKPIAVLNLNGYYDSLFGFLNQAKEEGFVTESYLNLVWQEPSVEAILDRLESRTTR